MQLADQLGHRREVGELPRDERAVDDVAVAGHDGRVGGDLLEHRRVAHRPAERVAVVAERGRRALFDEIAREHHACVVDERDEIAPGVRGPEVLHAHRPIAEIDDRDVVDEMVGRDDLDRLEVGLPFGRVRGVPVPWSSDHRSSSSRITRWPQISTGPGPRLAIAALPKVWSKCQCVLTIQRIGAVPNTRSSSSSSAASRSWHRVDEQQRVGTLARRRC